MRLIVGAMPTGERSSQAQQKDILAAFELFDKDDSGALDAKEFAAILTRPGETALSEDDAAEIIKEFDANGVCQGVGQARRTDHGKLRLH